MKYEVVAWDPPNKVVFVGESSTALAEDTITMRETSPGLTNISYTADIRLRGFISLFTFMVRGDIQALGGVARSGIADCFAKGLHKGLAALPK